MVDESCYVITKVQRSELLVKEKVKILKRKEWLPQVKFMKKFFYEWHINKPKFSMLLFNYCSWLTKVQFGDKLPIGSYLGKVCVTFYGHSIQHNYLYNMMQLCNC